MTYAKKFKIFLLISALAGCSQLIPRNQLADKAMPESTDNQVVAAQEEPLCEVGPEELAQFNPEDYSSTWDRLRAGYDLPQSDNPRIETHFKWYSRNKRYMARVSERAERYLFHIVSELESRDMPLELALLPIVESAFDPFAYSHGRASGMWQFIPSTGKNYGLKQNWWYDGRRDIEASTDAALKYLSYLHKRFDSDWLLALAAYNTGEGNVSRAIRRNKKAGKPTDYWSLSLPKETRAYVPQLLALAKLVANPEPYEITLAEIPNKPYFGRVEINSQIDLAQAAELAELDIDALYLLNAGFNRWATDPQGPHHLLLPQEKVETFINNLKAIPADERIGWERYKIKAGDSLLSISKRFHTSVEALREANGLRGNLIRQGKMMLIPVATKPAKHYAYSADQRLHRKQSNSRGKSGTQRTNYRVQPGDSFWKIANKYQISVASLVRWNGMAPKDTLKPGQKLVVWAKEGHISQTSTARSNKQNGSGIIRKVAYQVRQGDSLARIAGKFNLSVNDIVRWNPIKKTGYIHPGQSLTLFVDVTRTH